MAMKSVSLEPQSRSIARLVASDVVKGPGVRRYLSFPLLFMINRTAIVSPRIHIQHLFEGLLFIGSNLWPARVD